MKEERPNESDIRARDSVIDEHLHSTFCGSPLMIARGKALIDQSSYDCRALLRILDEERSRLDDAKVALRVLAAGGAAGKTYQEYAAEVLDRISNV
jgi:hypothetical protein